MATAKATTARQSAAERPRSVGRAAATSSNPARVSRRAVVPTTPTVGSRVAANAPPTCTLTTAASTIPTGPRSDPVRAVRGRDMAGV